MMVRLLNWFRTGPDRPLLATDPATIERLYERKRLAVFVSITLGYGFFYVGRLSLSVTKKPMLDEGVLTATQLGTVGGALLFCYAFGKFTNGFLADRSNIRNFMSTGLLASAMMNLALGFTTATWVFVALWGANGWFQSMGSAPSVVSISQWFSNRERGTRYGIWSISHSIGEGLTFAGTALLVGSFGWRWGFWAPGLLCVVAAAGMFVFMADRPQVYGLPPVSEYKADRSGACASAESIGAAQIEVLKNPAVWILGASSACMYVARYAVNNWAILFLQEAKQYSLERAGIVLAVYPVLGIAGAVASGFVSDRLFDSRRNAPALLFGLAQIGSLALFLFNPPGHVWIDVLAMAIFGFSLGALLCYLGGLMAVDICSKKASGAAMGLIGMFSYLGAAIQDLASGYLIDSSKIVVQGRTVHRFDSAIALWLGASVLSLVLAATVWKVKPKE